MKQNVEEEITKTIVLHANGNDYLVELLSYCVGRICIKVGRKGGDWKKQLHAIDVPHIVDWLKAAIINDADWLSNVDEKNRPKKLMKFGSFEDIQKEADKAMLRANQQNSDIKLVEGDEELYMKLENGFYLVELLTPAALDREGSQMQHCIGNGSYDGALKSDYYRLLSLRKGNGKPCATLEIEDNKLVQLQGKQNELPKKNYRDALKIFFQRSNIKSTIPSEFLGFVISADNQIYDLDKLPENLVINGNLDLIYSEISVLPNGLQISGDLDISGTEIEEIPSGIIIQGSLYARSSSIEKLPQNLEIGGSLDLEASNIKYLPSGLKVGLNMDINDTGITSLPDNMKVGGDLYLANLNINEIPKRLKVKGDLDIQGTQIDYLPEDLEVGGSIYTDKRDGFGYFKNLSRGNVQYCPI